MSSLIDRLRARSSAPEATLPDESPFSGLTSDVGASEHEPAPASGKFSGWSAFGPVEDSSEFRRVFAIPRRTPDTWLESDPRIDELTARFRTSNGTMRLKALQAQALYEAPLAGGLVGALAVGAGKTLTSLLLPKAMGVSRAVLMLRPSLVDKLFALELPHLSQHWRLPNVHGYPIHRTDEKCDLHVVAYSTLSSQKQADILQRLRPELLVLDEAHSLSDPSSTRTKRFKRYMREHPDVKVCVLTGSLLTHSYQECAHLMELALRESSPLPRASAHPELWGELQHWDAALAPKSLNRAPPGVLERLCAPGEDVRQGFGRRCRETLGFVATADNPLPFGLNFYQRPLTAPPEVMAALKKLREESMTPWDEPVFEALEVARYVRQIVCGMAYRRTWPREEPQDVRERWLNARKEWNKEVRDFLGSTSYLGMDSPGLLYQGAARWERLRETYASKTTAGGKRRYGLAAIVRRLNKYRRRVFQSASWKEWNEVEHTAEPGQEEYWVSEYMARDAVEWGKEHTGIIWVHHTAFGLRVAELGGFPFYGEGEDAASAIAKESGKRTIVAMVQSHGTGRNLQAFHKQLVCTPGSNPKEWEQLLGRTRREGQKADEVETWVYVHTPELEDALARALEGARGIEASLRTQQHLCAGTWTFEPKRMVGGSKVKGRGADEDTEET